MPRGDVSAWRDAGLSPLTRGHYSELSSPETKLDPRDSQFKLLDVTPDLGLSQHRCRDGCRLQLHALCRSGRTPGGALSRETWNQLDEVHDRPARGDRCCPGGRESITSYLRSLRSGNTEAVFSVRDPLPGMAELLLIPYMAVKRGF